MQIAELKSETGNKKVQGRRCVDESTTGLMYYLAGTFY